MPGTALIILRDGENATHSGDCRSACLDSGAEERYMNRALEEDGVNHEGLRLILTTMARHGRTAGECYS